MHIIYIIHMFSIFILFLLFILLYFYIIHIASNLCIVLIVYTMNIECIMDVGDIITCTAY